MLERIGVTSVDALFEPIPREGRLIRPLAVEPALDELSLMDHLGALAKRNTAADALSFLGAGMYDHHVPPAVDQLLLRSEFYTAYTPYQAEVSQGTLQAIYEFQTIVCELYGMAVANASMYDGASACAEAVLMARRTTKRAHTIMSGALHPEYRETVHTYLAGLMGKEPDLHEAELDAQGRTDLGSLERQLRDDTAAVVVGYPNFFGVVEDLAPIAELAHARGALLIVANWEPYAMSVLAPPGAQGADIVVGEGQALAVPPQLGGPGVGLFATRSDFVRQMPGRLVGETVDTSGERGFVLTLSTREQHIRRDRATSNICTNHGLIALAMAIRTSMLGRVGFEAVGKQCLAKAEYFKTRIREASSLELASTAPTFNEVAVRSTRGPAAPRLATLARDSILGGVSLDRWYPERTQEFLVAFTERHRRAHIDRLVDALEAT
jgi:glycine dehydrogenase subunit 1